MKLYVVCNQNRLIEAIQMSVRNKPIYDYCLEDRKRVLNLSLTPFASWPGVIINPWWLEHISTVPKMFEPWMFDCTEDFNYFFFDCILAISLIELQTTNMCSSVHGPLSSRLSYTFIETLYAVFLRARHHTVRTLLGVTVDYCIESWWARVFCILGIRVQ